MALSQWTYPRSLTAGADLSSPTAAEGYVVQLQGAGTAILATDGTISGGQVLCGIITQGGGNTSGGQITVAVNGPAYARAGGVLTRGTHKFLTVDATGRLVAAATGDQIVAIWDDSGEDAAAAAGDLIPVFVTLHRYAAGTVAADFRRPSLSIAAEAADVIKLSVQIVNLAAANVAAAHTIHVRLYAADMIESLAAAFTLTDGGAGAVVSTTANAGLLYTTTAAGLAEIDVTDVAGGSGATIYAEVLVESAGNYVGLANFIAITFDGV